jgi:iron complex transport system permease protein
MNKSYFTFLWILVLIFLTLVLFTFALTSGSVSIPLQDLVISLLGHSGANPISNPIWERIIWDIRLPRCMAALIGGACLALSGLEMQTLFRNPLAGPYSMGISSGATLGVALAVMATSAVGAGSLPGWIAMGGIWSQFGIAGSAVLGAGLVMALVLFLSHRIRSNTTLLILGLMFGQIAGAVVSLLQAFSNADQIRAFTIWGFGSYAGVTWAQMPILAAAFAIGLALAAASAKPLNALLLGWNYAKSLGVPVQGLRVMLIASASLLAGAVTAFCGPIAFIGLAVPHLGRGIFRTADHRILIPACVLLGASLSLAADLVCRLPGNDRALPLNAVLAIVGAPVVIWVLVRRQTGSERQG